MNSFLKFYFWYLVIIQFHSIQIRPNSLEHTEYCSYLVGTKEALERCSTWVGFGLACKFLDQTEKGCQVLPYPDLSAVSGASERSRGPVS